MFQKIVVSKYLNSQNKENLSAQWDLFSAHFHDPAVQENIRNSKEEQYQEGFLRDLFVNVLGYTLNPTIGFNLTTEYKNIKDSKKADGAIVIDGNVVGVIELKGTNTTDLGKVEVQAFNYKNNQRNCTYVITSNFEKIRLYIDDSIRFIEFNLFTLQQHDFNLLYLLFSFESIKNDVPKKVKDESLNQEDIVTKKLYKDYSVFKRELFQNLTDLNPEWDPLELFKKTQKLLDRFLFLLFGEDRGLLPPNSVRQILEQWNKLKDLDAYDPLYNRYKKYFGYLNTGFKGKNHDVFAYNGGLFKGDEILDNIRIDDRILYDHTFKLSQYDFASEVDVNILGHIFENSLNEIDEIKAQLEGQEIDKSKSKRKKDGVFYTPKNITKYIVENTVGKLCEEKKGELGIVEEDYFTDKKRQQKTLKHLIDKLDDYRTWLLQITVVDPACGSGAFLNEALNFLINEHQYIDELEAKLRNVPIVFSYHSESILEHNLFGVDLNEESVEIAKLSLWLRTAEPYRKLNSLSDNIKCGNSLIDDPEVAGEKAFNWEKEFPQVFAKGGFDVVIGNPPYVSSREISQNQKTYYYNRFRTAQYRINLYTLFCELVFSLLKESGQYSLIIPNYWLSTQWDSELRTKLTQEHTCYEILNTYEVFSDVNVDTVIINGCMNKVKGVLTHLCAVDKNFNRIEDRLEAIANREYSISKFQDLDNEKVEKQIILGVDDWELNKETVTLGDLLIFTTGMQPYEEGKGNPIQTEEMRKMKVYHSPNKIDDSYLPLLGASHVQWMLIKPFSEYIKYGPNLSAMRDPSSFRGPRILMNRILSKDKIDGCLITEDNVINNSDVIVLRARNSTVNMAALLGIITSRYCAYSNKGRNINLQRKVYPKLNVGTLKAFPIPKIKPADIEVLEKYVMNILELRNQEFHANMKFQKMLLASYGISKLSQKLKNWHQIEFGDFINELKNSIALSTKSFDKKVSHNNPKLTKTDEFEWMELFEDNKKKVQMLQALISRREQQIDEMVYELYGLTEEEIGIVENS